MVSRMMSDIRLSNSWKRWLVPLPTVSLQRFKFEVWVLGVSNVQALCAFLKPISWLSWSNDYYFATYRREVKWRSAMYFLLFENTMHSISFNGTGYDEWTDQNNTKTNYCVIKRNKYINQITVENNLTTLDVIFAVGKKMRLTSQNYSNTNIKLTKYWPLSSDDYHSISGS